MPVAVVKVKGRSGNLGNDRQTPMPLEEPLPPPTLVGMHPSLPPLLFYPRTHSHVGSPPCPYRLKLIIWSALY